MPFIVRCVSFSLGRILLVLDALAGEVVSLPRAPLPGDLQCASESGSGMIAAQPGGSGGLFGRV